MARGLGTTGITVPSPWDHELGTKRKKAYAEKSAPVGPSTGAMLCSMLFAFKCKLSLTSCLRESESGGEQEADRDEWQGATRWSRAAIDMD